MTNSKFDELLQREQLARGGDDDGSVVAGHLAARAVQRRMLMAASFACLVGIAILVAVLFANQPPAAVPLG